MAEKRHKRWEKVEEGLIHGLSEFVGWDTSLIVRKKLMPVVKRFCKLKSKEDHNVHKCQE